MAQRRAKKASQPIPEINDPYEDYAARFLSLPDDEKFEVVTWQVNNIRHLIKKGKTLDVTPIRSFIDDHNCPAVVCLQDIRIHREDEKMRGEVEEAVNDGNEGQYRAYFSLRGGRHGEYELRENAEYVFSQGNNQPRNDISGVWYGVCTLVRHDYVDFIELDEGGGQKEWDVWGRFNILRFVTPQWKLAVFNCFFPDVRRRGNTRTHILAFTGARYDDLKAATDPDTNAVHPDYIQRWFSGYPHPYEYLDQDSNQLKTEGYPEAVINELGQTTKNDHEFRAELHKHVIKEARACAADGFHILLIGAMRISPRDWQNVAVRHRPNGYKPEFGHNQERLDFDLKFLNQSQQKYMRGFDTWKMVNKRHKPNIHYSIVSHNLGESDAVVMSEVLKQVEIPGTPYYDGNDINVSKSVIFHLPSLAAAEVEGAFPMADDDKVGGDEGGGEDGEGGGEEGDEEGDQLKGMEEGGSQYGVMEGQDGEYHVIEDA